MIVFTVFGEPIPQGSLKAFMPKGRRFPVVTADNPRTRPWKFNVTSAAREALKGAPPIQGSVGLELGFYLPRPKSTPKRVAAQIKKPDLDKLIRAVLDALTAAGAWNDDSQVTRVSALKRFAATFQSPGIPRAEIKIFEDFQ
jgi:crossover junction endodeoxyribonuclease RusA